MTTNPTTGRSGMTLVELLVVMVIMLILATIVVAFAPGFQDAQKVSRGADQLQGWLVTARMWAKKDRVPTGIRFYTTTDQLTNRTIITDLQYIQQPPTFIVPNIIGNATPTYRRISSKTSSPTQVILEPPFSGAILAGTPNKIATIGDFSGGFGANSLSTNWPVQQNDFLVVKGIVHQITAVSSSTTPPQECDLLTLASNVNPTLTDSSGNQVFTSDYYIVRSPRALAGETTLKLPQDVVIDLNLSQFPAGSSGQSDILFSPSGEVLQPPSSDKVILWVRDQTKRPPAPTTTTTSQAVAIDRDSLIVIDIRTGFVAAQSVNPDSSNYYAYTKDGKSSGL